MISRADLNEGQVAALDALLAWARDEGGPRLLSLSGPAGTGKTTLLHLFAEEADTATWSAMTGRAARRMRDVGLKGARTAHSALYHRPREVDNRRDRRIELEFDKVRKDDPGLLVIDEASMIDRRFLAHVGQSIYEKILLVGDPVQIPPVNGQDKNGGEDWSVFGAVPGPCLTEVMRTSGAIVETATRVRERQEIIHETLEHGGSRYDYTTDFRGALRDWFDDRDDHVLITWRNEVRMNLNRQIRQILGRSSPLPEVGEPVVIRKNDHKKEIMNGDILFVDGWEGDGPIVAGIATRYVRIRSRQHPPIPTAAPEDIDPWADDGSRVILTALEGRDHGPFDGSLPYVGLDAWNRGLVDAGLARWEGRDLIVEEPVIPLSYGYVLTGHLCMGSEYRRATTLILNDLMSRNFRKPTTLPDGTKMPFAIRYIYTCLTRAKERSIMVVT